MLRPTSPPSNGKPACLLRLLLLLFLLLLFLLLLFRIPCSALLLGGGRRNICRTHQVKETRWKETEEEPIAKPDSRRSFSLLLLPAPNKILLGGLMRRTPPPPLEFPNKGKRQMRMGSITFKKLVVFVVLSSFGNGCVEALVAVPCEDEDPTCLQLAEEGACHGKG